MRAFVVDSKEIEKKLNEANLKIAQFVVTKDFTQAISESKKTYDLVRNYEDKQLGQGKRIHKGGIFHTWGFLLNQTGNEQQAIRLYLLAYIEDLLDYDSFSSAKNCPAHGKLLNNQFISQQMLEKVEIEVQKRLDKGLIPRDSEAILKSVDSGAKTIAGEPVRVKIERSSVLQKTKDSSPLSKKGNATEWNQLNDKIQNLQADIKQFHVEFIDREAFKKFCDSLAENLKELKDICITGYFSETIRTELENLAKNDSCSIRLISPDFQLGTPRDKKNLEALRKLSKARIEVKFNSRMHARLLVGHSPVYSLLILGSFDYNTECIGKERYDAGIKTTHPDLVKSATDFFEQVWNDSETQTLEQFLKDKKIIA